MLLCVDVTDKSDMSMSHPRVASNSSKSANVLEVEYKKAKKCGKGRDMYFDIRRWISTRVERERGK